MAIKSEEEIIKKPTASRGRPRKDAQASKAKKSSKSKTKKKSTKKASSSKKSTSKKVKSTTLKNVENVELINDVQIENTIPLITVSEETVLEEIVETSPVENNLIEDTLNLVIEEESTEEIETIIAEDEIINLDAQEIGEESLIEEVPETQEQVVEEDISSAICEEVTEKPKKKRTIKNLSIKRSIPVVEEVIESEPEIEEEIIEESIVEEPVIEKIIELPVREKRTLRLNLGSKKQQVEEPVYKKDESINQNSAFFNEPSIFAKFNIDIISTDADDNTEIQDEIIEESSTSEEEALNDIEIIDETIVLQNDQIDELICETIVNQIIEEPTSISEEENTIEDLNDELLEQTILEEISKNISEETIEEELENSEILKSVRSILGGKLGSLEELTQEEEILPQDEQQDLIDEQDNVILFKNLVEDEEIIDNDDNEFLQIDQEEPEVLKEVADTIISDEPVSDNSPIGKFFDSSIPSMTSTVNNTFSKIKKSIFSNISPIFKKFTFEEATLMKHQDEFENNYNESENNLSDIQQALENFTPNVQATTNIVEMDILAESPSTMPVIDTTTLVTTNNDEMVYEGPELSILTPASESSFDEDKELDEFIENAEQGILDDIEELENFEDPIDEIDETDEEENIIPEEIIEEEYDDEEFSIESYFGLDDVTLDEKDLKRINAIEDKIEDEVVEIEEHTSNPDEFVDKFLETNPIIEEIQEETIEEEALEETIQEETLSVELEPEQFVDKLLEDNISQEEVITEKNSSKEVISEEVPEIIEEPVIENKESELEKALKEKNEELSSLSKLLETFTQTISTLTNRITDLENRQAAEPVVEEPENPTSDIIEDLIEESQSEIEEELSVDDIDINDLDLDDLDIEDLEFSEEEFEEPSLLSQENDVETEIETSVEEDEKSVESILSEVLLSKDLDSELKEELLSEVLSYEENLSPEDLDESLLEAALFDELSDEELLGLDSQEEKLPEEEPLSDFSKIIESLTKAITELEQTPDIKEVEKPKKVVPLAPLPAELTNYSGSEDKAINILINKDDIFSISILNETYEIVADFDGISVLSENLHISTPKNNFFVRVGNKYIEIHNKKDNFILNTNFEDIEFANAINNIAFAKKNNKIELNIKEAFKLSSVNNKIELSMLNKAIADLSTPTQQAETKDESSICDNKTLLISEETQKVYLPYTIEDVMKKLKSGDEYQTVQEVVDNEYTLPLSTFKMPIISRFKEAYRFMRTKENSSVYAAVDLALELMFNSNLNPAVIRAAKDMKELNIYLDCLYENEVEKFDCFKIVYKVLPKIK